MQPPLKMEAASFFVLVFKSRIKIIEARIIRKKERCQEDFL